MDRHCDECERWTGRRRRHEQVFTDSATGRSYCTEHMLMFAGWLMDGQTEEPDLFAHALPGASHSAGGGQ
jgi:hypothetical protein